MINDITQLQIFFNARTRSTLGTQFLYLLNYTNISIFLHYKGKKKGGKAVPLKASSGPECSRKLPFPNFMTTAQDGDKVVNLTHRPPLPSGNTPGTHFC
jgi:hypothetical protein